MIFIIKYSEITMKINYPPRYIIYFLFHSNFKFNYKMKAVRILLLQKIKTFIVQWSLLNSIYESIKNKIKKTIFMKLQLSLYKFIWVLKYSQSNRSRILFHWCKITYKKVNETFLSVYNKTRTYLAIISWVF